MKNLQSIIVVKHIFIWLVCIYIGTIDYIEYTEKIPSLTWWQMAYNWGSLILVFYAIIFFMIRNSKGNPFANVYLSKQGLYYKKRKEYYFPAIIAVTLYLIVSLMLDNYLFKYEYPTFRAHLLQRFSTVFPVFLIALNNANRVIERKGFGEVLHAKDRRIDILNDDTNDINRRFDEIVNEKSSN